MPNPPCGQPIPACRRTTMTTRTIAKRSATLNPRYATSARRRSSWRKSEEYFSGMRVTLRDGIVTIRITGEQLEAALFLAYDVHSRARTLKGAYYAAAGEA